MSKRITRQKHRRQMRRVLNRMDITNVGTSMCRAGYGRGLTRRNYRSTEKCENNNTNDVESKRY